MVLPSLPKTFSSLLNPCQPRGQYSQLMKVGVQLSAERTEALAPADWAPPYGGPLWSRKGGGKRGDHSKKVMESGNKEKRAA